MKTWWTIQIKTASGWVYQESTSKGQKWAESRAEVFRKGSKRTGSPVEARVVEGKWTGTGNRG